MAGETTGVDKSAPGESGGVARLMMLSPGRGTGDRDCGMGGIGTPRSRRSRAASVERDSCSQLCPRG